MLSSPQGNPNLIARQNMHNPTTALTDTLFHLQENYGINFRALLIQPPRDDHYIEWRDTLYLYGYGAY